MEIGSLFFIRVKFLQEGMLRMRFAFRVTRDEIGENWVNFLSRSSGQVRPNSSLAHVAWQLTSDRFEIYSFLFCYYRVATAAVAFLWSLIGATVPLRLYYHHQPRRIAH